MVPFGSLAEISLSTLPSQANLGLPKYATGQVVKHRHRPLLRGVVIDVDLLCIKPEDWAISASCLERAVATGAPPEECLVEGVTRWRKQPFYVVLPDLAETPWEKGVKEGAGTPDDLPWPHELSSWQVSPEPQPLHLGHGLSWHRTAGT